jgi:NAD(P)-dependent dehydrogenase (short-subunit alcohol dehydrogenase family)
MKDIIASFGPRLFADKEVVVSGASSGIGLAIAQGFAALGAQVVATGTSAAKLDKAGADPASAGIRFDTLDVRDAAAVKRWIGARERIDILVNAQGIARPGTEWDEAEFLNVIDINLSSAFRLTMAALPQLEASRGSVIHVASMLSYLADAEVPAYNASKTGILGLTRSMAHRFGPKGIRVNAIAPGYHVTDMTQGLWSDPAHERRIAERAALKRWGTVDDLVGATAFLCTPAAAFITGVVLPVDGGYHTG